VLCCTVCIHTGRLPAVVFSSVMFRHCQDADSIVAACYPWVARGVQLQSQLAVDLYLSPIVEVEIQFEFDRNLMNGMKHCISARRP
jgi:hypothetical protein